MTQLLQMLLISMKNQCQWKINVWGLTLGSCFCTMKGAAKCDKHCELQNSVNRQGLERILCFWDIPESMPASVSMLCCSSGCCLLRACCCDCLCLRMCAGASEAFDQEGSAQQPAYQASLCADSCAVCGNCSVLLLCWLLGHLKHSRHEVRLANPLNLSI